MYLVPAENTAGLFGETPDRPKTWLPVICHGPKQMLSRAYLLGCIDYLKTPWLPEELYYRVYYTGHARFQSFFWRNISFSPFQAVLEEQIIELTKQEYTVFYILKNNPGQSISRKALAYALWDRERPGSRAVDMHISALRKKIGGLIEEEPIYTIHGEGYMLKPDF